MLILVFVLHFELKNEKIANISTDFLLSHQHSQISIKSIVLLNSMFLESFVQQGENGRQKEENKLFLAAAKSKFNLQFHLNVSA